VPNRVEQQPAVQEQATTDSVRGIIPCMGKNTRIVKVGTVLVGGGHPPPVQTMWKDPLATGNLDAAVVRIGSLASLGCRIVRFAVPAMDDVEALGVLASMVTMPLVADIHFDWRIALRCLDFPIAKIRVNPGNLGAPWKLREVAAKAAGKGVPIRIGVNAGSLPKDLAGLYEAASGRLAAYDPRQLEVRSGVLVEAAERELAALDALGFTEVIVSMKASSVADTVACNRLFASRHDIPLHVGVTEAGPLVQGCVRSAAALFGLLSDGIGDTLRVSLSSDMEDEVIAAAELVCLATGLREGADIVSCPRCGRAGFDTHGFASRWRDRILGSGKPVTVAIMGCVVNGPGEARHADIGITGAGNKVIVFRRGEIARTCAPEDADTVFWEEFDSL
jgi:(E)-4-hydroxy-3-methylbut-2-enyl-diphosphate synthase